MLKADMVIDLQFGSTGKGSLVGYLAMNGAYDTAIAAWGPNAGHTFVDRFGNAFIHTMLPIAAIAPSVRRVLIGPGSVVNWKSLFEEARHLAASMESVRNYELIVHPQAMMIHPRHIEAEKVNVRIGSTMKGTGAALIEKIQRDPGMSPLVRDMADFDRGHYVKMFELIGVRLIIDEEAYNDAVDKSEYAIIEGAQGYSLGVNRHFWPYTTSREITPAQVISDCGIPIPDELFVWGTLRTYPIRVANRYDKDGNQVGTSGGHYHDQEELTWEQLGREPEFTTVTKLKRRVFSFSGEQTRQAVRHCKPDALFLNFCNYCVNEDEVCDLAKNIESICALSVENPPFIQAFGFGPAIGDVRDRRTVMRS